MSCYAIASMTSLSLIPLFGLLLAAALPSPAHAVAPITVQMQAVHELRSQNLHLPAETLLERMNGLPELKVFLPDQLVWEPELLQNLVEDIADTLPLVRAEETFPHFRRPQPMSARDRLDTSLLILDWAVLRQADRIWEVVTEPHARTRATRLQAAYGMGVITLILGGIVTLEETNVLKDPVVLLGAEGAFTAAMLYKIKKIVRYLLARTPQLLQNPGEALHAKTRENTVRFIQTVLEKKTGRKLSDHALDHLRRAEGRRTANLLCSDLLAPPLRVSAGVLAARKDMIEQQADLEDEGYDPYSSSAWRSQVIKGVRE